MGKKKRTVMYLLE